jgi:hypothetical protein
MVDPNGMMSGGPCLKVPYKHKEDAWEEDGEQPIIRLWPKYQVGDLLWVRETWKWDDCKDDSYDGAPADIGMSFVTYKAQDPKQLWHWCTHDLEVCKRWADNDECFNSKKWRPSIHMPKWAARIWLEVTGVKVERVQDISEDDAKREGVRLYIPNGYEAQDLRGFKKPFRDLWESIYPGSWDRNDWVAAYTFRRVEK